MDYGLTERQRRLLLRSIKHCGICGKRFSTNRPACIDHNHRTGEVRGLLCRNCNGLIGALNDNADWLSKAASYIARPPARITLGTRVYVPNSPGAAGLSTDDDRCFL